MSTVTIARVATVRELLAPKLRMSRRRFQGEGSQLRTVVLGLVGVIFWAVLFAIIYRMLLYFKTAAGIGDVLALKLLGLILLAFMSVLLLSNIITSLTSFFLARDLELTPATVTNHLAAMRRQFRAILLERLRELTSTEAEWEAEAAKLLGHPSSRVTSARSRAARSGQADDL